MRNGAAMLAGMMLAAGLSGGCGSSGGGKSSPPPETKASAPVVTTSPALNGAVIVNLATKTTGATIYYTEDGSAPTNDSTQYEAPFLVAANLTVKAVAWLPGDLNSDVTTQSFAPNIASGTLVWSDEFTNATSGEVQPNPAVWTYDTGNGGFGNNELETYCAWGVNTAPCSTSSPSAYLGPDGYLHIAAQKTAAGGYTSARLKTQGLFSFQYGRIEFFASVPEAQGLWPAAWLMGNNIATANWPACGEMDVLERVDAAKMPDWNEGSVHGTGFTGNLGLGTVFNFPAGQTAAGWHTYGMIWKPGSVAYYVDDATKPYVTYTNPGSLSGLTGAVWPFDNGQASFILLNLAVGGDWPGNPDGTTPFPSEMLVDYVRVYTN